MFNDGPQRYRGHRFDDRNWDRPDTEFNEFENRDLGPPPPGNRQGRRSRWGHSDEDHDQVHGEENIGSTTPVFDEYPQDTTMNDKSSFEGNGGFLQNVEISEGNQGHFEPNRAGNNENFQQNQEIFDNHNRDQFDMNMSNNQGEDGSFQEGGTSFQEGGDNLQGQGDSILERSNNFQEGGNNFTEDTDNYQKGENYFQTDEANIEGGGSNFQEDRHLQEDGGDFQQNSGDMIDNANVPLDTGTDGDGDVGQSHTEGGDGGEQATD